MTAKSIENQFTGGKTSQKRIRRSIYDAPHIFFPLSPFPRKNGSICGKRWSINVDRSILEPRRTRSKRRNATATANAPRRRTKADRKRRCRARDTRTVRCRSGACCGSFNRIPNATGASIAELRRRLPLVSLGSAPPSPLCHRFQQPILHILLLFFFCCRSNPFNSPNCPVFFSRNLSALVSLWLHFNEFHFYPFLQGKDIVGSLHIMKNICDGIICFFF